MRSLLFSCIFVILTSLCALVLCRPAFASESSDAAQPSTGVVVTLNADGMQSDGAVDQQKKSTATATEYSQSALSESPATSSAEAKAEGSTEKGSTVTSPEETSAASGGSVSEDSRSADSHLDSRTVAEGASDSPETSSPSSSASVSALTSVDDSGTDAGEDISSSKAAARVAAVSTVSTSQPIASGVYSIHSALDPRKVVDVPAARKTDSVQLDLYDENSTLAQYFYVSYLGDGWYTITNVNSGKSLDVRYGGASNGTVVQQYAANGTAAQKWRFVSVGSFFELVPPISWTWK